MRWRFLIVAVALVSAAADDDASKKDLERLQGTWQQVSQKWRGREVPEGLVKGEQVVITGSTWQALMAGKKRGKPATLVLDATKKPATLDIKYEGETELGIYELDKDSLKVCVATDERPKEFASKPGSTSTLMVFKRVKK
jgi:uncharacterized protein (TIGR03067 family)